MRTVENQDGKLETVIQNEARKKNPPIPHKHNLSWTSIKGKSSFHTEWIKQEAYSYVRTCLTGSACPQMECESSAELKELLMIKLVILEEQSQFGQE